MAAVAKAHDQLYHGSDIERMDIGKYIEAICKDLQASVSQSTIHTDVKYGIEVSTDRAISSALIVNELITNAAKYANPDKSGGTIWVTVAPVGDDDFSISANKSLRPTWMSAPLSYWPVWAVSLDRNS